MVYMYHSFFITALFIIARTWKQPRCPSADEWIRKLSVFFLRDFCSYPSFQRFLQKLPLLSCLLFNYLIFNWKIIVLQCCISFCHRSTWISHRYTYVFSLLNLPPTSHHIPSFQVVTEHQVELPASYRKFPLAVHFTYCNVQVSILLSQFMPPSFPRCVHNSVLCICFLIAVLQVVSSVLFF